MNRKLMCGVVFAALGVTFAEAQVSIYPAVRADNGNTGPGIETAIVASKLAPGELVVGWIDWRTGKNQIGSAISLDAGATFTDAVLIVPSGLIPDPNTQNAADPMVACDALRGDRWISGLSVDGADSNPSGLFLARKPANCPCPGTAAR